LYMMLLVKNIAVKSWNISLVLFIFIFWKTAIHRFDSFL
jgi:hypothetical protein